MDPRDDAGFMANPMRWPNMILPVKRNRQYEKNIGCLVGDGPTVYFFNMWDIPEVKEWKEIEHHTYTDFQAIVDDGWRVD